MKSQRTSHGKKLKSHTKKKSQKKESQKEEFGDGGVSLFVTRAIFGDHGVSLVVAGAILDIRTEVLLAKLDPPNTPSPTCARMK